MYAIHWSHQSKCFLVIMILKCTIFNMWMRTAFSLISYWGRGYYFRGMVWSSFLDFCFVTFYQSVLTIPPFWLQRLPQQRVPAVREPQGADLCDAELFWGVDGAEHQRLLLRPETDVHTQPRPGQVRPLQGRVHLHLHKRRLPCCGRLEKVRHLWRQDRATGKLRRWRLYPTCIT